MLRHLKARETFELEFRAHGQVKDKLEPFFKEYGEFFFRTKVTSGAMTVEHRLPEKGHWEISDHPRFSRVDKIDRILFEGEPADHRGQGPERRTAD